MWKSYYLCCFIILIAAITKIHMISIERSEKNYGQERYHEKLLSRRRRYLTFPEGSSMQLGNFLKIWYKKNRWEKNSINSTYLVICVVYDQIIGVVDFTNLHIFGITCSLAWQLPHKTFYHTEHAEATMHNRKISIIVNKSAEIDLNEQPQYTGHVYHFDTYYNRSNYHSHNLDSDYYKYLKSMSKIERPPINRQYQYDDWQKYRTNKIRWNYSHDIYPALRMRRHIAKTHNASHIHHEVKRSLRHHRETRFSLYKSIERYLNAYVIYTYRYFQCRSFYNEFYVISRKGENGDQCIKLAICETIQIEHKHGINEPEPFFRELLRVIFR